MAIIVDLKGFSYKQGSGKGAINSPEELYDLCTPPQLNRLAENILGHRFEKGTKKMPACEMLFEAMLEGATASDESMDEETPKKAKDKGGRKPSTTGKKKPAAAKKEKPAAAPKEKKERALKEYALGRAKKIVEEKGNIHLVVISEAITALLKEKVKIATQEEIMERAVELGLYDRKKSKQAEKAIFSWWRKKLFEAGFLKEV